MRLLHCKVILALTLFALVSCGGKEGELRITGEIKGLNNADLTVFSSDDLIMGIDTIAVRQGKIDWSCRCDKKRGSLTIVYPTFSTLTVFGGNGDVIRIKGDAKQLRATRVEGNADNEAYTMLRKQTENVTQERKDSLERAFMIQNPESPVTRLLHRESLKRQSPSSLNVGDIFPDFLLVTRKGDTLSSDSLRGKFALIAFWANWRGGNSSMNIRIRRLMRQAKEPLECISYNMDLNGSMLDYLERTDTIIWHSYGDKRAFLADLPSRLELRDIPYFILVDTALHVMAMGGDWQKDIEPSLKVITSPQDSTGR